MQQSVVSFTKANQADPAKISLLSTVFEHSDAGFNKDLVYQAIMYYRSLRPTTKAQKTRAEVSFSKKKPWRQKGTGNARSGTKGSPIWRSGGVTFAAKPRFLGKKLPKKMYRLAMRNIFSEHHRLGSLVVVDEVALPEIKTQHFNKVLDDHGWAGQVLFVVDEKEDKALLSSRNIHRVQIHTVNELNPYDLFRAQHVVVSEKAIKLIEAWLNVKS
jgi:large subunit ribosomal protein L4